MKVALIFFAVLGLSHAEDCYKCDEIKECESKCSDADKEGKFICLNDGVSGRYTRCTNDCFYKVHGGLGSDTEVDCKPGHFAHCWNNECPAEEKVKPSDGKSVCDDKVVQQKSFPTVCHLKCFFGKYNKEASPTSCEKQNETYDRTNHGKE